MTTCRPGTFLACSSTQATWSLTTRSFCLAQLLGVGVLLLDMFQVLFNHVHLRRLIVAVQAHPFGYVVLGHTAADRRGEEPERGVLADDL